QNEAKRMLESALSLAPEHSTALSSYAALLEDHEWKYSNHQKLAYLQSTHNDKLDYHTALDICQRSWNLKNNQDGALAIARVCAVIGNLAKAEDILTDILQQSPQLITAKLNLQYGFLKETTVAVKTYL
ncbi:unnamed protein product, partial [Meganyctiphanes norvegica]